MATNVPKSPDRRSRGSGRRFESVELVTVPAPELPPRADGEDYLPQTLDYYESWVEQSEGAPLTRMQWHQVIKAVILTDEFFRGNYHHVDRIRAYEKAIGVQNQDFYRQNKVVHTTHEKEGRRIVEAHVVEEPRAIEQDNLTPYQRRLNELMEVHKHMPDDLYSVLEKNMKDLHWRELRDLEGAPNG